ncbi:peptidase domain-containing ABC transporter [Pendulispora albinea]|uniref:Peptidase domain-containing ABC transporter n=1 Tax=Pendulispora albinea TaxID=2741071 RepID=A0ABZ2LJE3_9BACT
MNFTSIAETIQKHPALAALGQLGPKKRVPVLVQLEAADCGPTCLQMCLAFHGQEVRLDELRLATGCNRDGVSALALVQTARDYGLAARGVRIELEDLFALEPGTILHWGFAHFVVFEHVIGETVHIVDPGIGRRALSLEEVSESFTGVALVFEVQEGFQKGKLERPLRHYLKKTMRGTGDWVRVVAMSMVLQLCGLLLPFINGRVIDRVIPHSDKHLLTVMILGLATVALFEFFAMIARSNLLLNLRTRLDAQMTLGFLDHLLSLPYPFFQRRHAGDLMMRLNSNAQIREILSSGVLSGAIDGLLVLVYLALLLSLSPKLAIVAIILVTLEATVCLIVQKKQAGLLTSAQQKQAESESQLVELLNGIETLKTTGTEGRAAQRWSNVFVEVMNLSLQRGRMSAWSDAILKIVTTLSPFILLIVGVFETMAGKMTLGTMFGALAFADAFIHPVSSLIGTFSQFQLVGVYIDRIEDVMTTPKEQVRNDLRTAPPLRGSIHVDNISFQYGPKSKMVVKNVSLQIAPGQSVALVGRSGSGKSTLAALLAGLYVPTEGKITYDGINLADLHLPSLRRQIGIVIQRPYVFGTTVRANITNGDASISSRALEKAGKAAAIHDEIMEMPMGYETPLTAGGATLSGGQRQRLALAAALLKKPPILLLDEATSALDNLTERAVHDNLDRLGCTRIIIAHRLSTIRRADVILVMNDGVLVEQGDHESLVAEGGLYASLIAAQSSDHEPAEDEKANYDEFGGDA